MKLFRLFALVVLSVRGCVRAQQRLPRSSDYHRRLFSDSEVTTRKSLRRQMDCVLDPTPNREEDKSESRIGYRGHRRRRHRVDCGGAALPPR